MYFRLRHSRVLGPTNPRLARCGAASVLCKEKCVFEIFSNTLTFFFFYSSTKMKHTLTLLTKSYHQMQLERDFFFYLQLHLITNVELLHV